jgi:hypothetical protein
MYTDWHATDTSIINIITTHQANYKYLAMLFTYCDIKPINGTWLFVYYEVHLRHSIN